MRTIRGNPLLTFFPALPLSLALLVGCASTVLFTTGFHAPLTDESMSKRYRFVVWGNHPAMVNAIIERVQREGHTVVERARLQEIFNEQKISLSHTVADEAHVLRVGRLLGAERLVFAEATITPAVLTRGAYYRGYGGVRSEAVYHVSVAVRGVNMETGEIRWSGTARFGEPLNNPELGVVVLALAAIGRALCPIERGYEWREFGQWTTGGLTGGCIKKE